MIALTGGAGFLGYHVANYFSDKADALAQEPSRFALIDIADYIESDYPEGTEFLTGDIRDAAGLRE